MVMSTGSVDPRLESLMKDKKTSRILTEMGEVLMTAADNEHARGSKDLALHMMMLSNLCSHAAIVAMQGGL